MHELMFVCSGLLRFYYLAEDGTESNKAFAAENDFAGPLAASYLDLPVIYGIQTLEPTTMLVANYYDFVALFDEHPVFDRLGRRLAEWFLVRKELRTRSLLQHQAKDRYLTFKERFPQITERVPQYHIASYLGITEVTLSRLKRSLRQETRQKKETVTEINQPRPRFGSSKHLNIEMSDDFDEPLEDFAEYME